MVNALSITESLKVRRKRAVSRERVKGRSNWKDQYPFNSLAATKRVTWPIATYFTESKKMEPKKPGDAVGKTVRVFIVLSTS